jgi:hypothetical protein
VRQRCGSDALERHTALVVLAIKASYRVRRLPTLGTLGSDQNFLRVWFQIKTAEIGLDVPMIWDNYLRPLAESLSAESRFDEHNFPKQKQR